jgi:hypothetical protein
MAMTNRLYLDPPGLKRRPLAPIEKMGPKPILLCAQPWGERSVKHITKTKREGDVEYESCTKH